jgi:hypothetical protein
MDIVLDGEIDEILLYSGIMAAEEMVGKLATAEYNKKRLCNSSSKKYRRRWFFTSVQA